MTNLCTWIGHHSIHSFDSHIFFITPTGGGGGYGNDGYGDRGKLPHNYLLLKCCRLSIDAVHSHISFSYSTGGYGGNQGGSVNRAITLYKLASSWRLAHINLLSLSLLVDMVATRDMETAVAMGKSAFVLFVITLFLCSV